MCCAQFGTYRVEVVVNLFHRLVDLHNFELVLSVLTPHEVACVQCRIGLLNILNPMKPEGFHAVDLGSREERVAAKILAALSFVEPGENWVSGLAGVRYQREQLDGAIILAVPIVLPCSVCIADVC